MRLNAQQAAAAQDVANHVLVAAGAGTGKTQCVVGRLLYALGEEVAGRRLDKHLRLDLRDVAAISYLVIILLAALLLGWREGLFFGQEAEQSRDRYTATSA